MLKVSQFVLVWFIIVKRNIEEHSEKLKDYKQLLTPNYYIMSQKLLSIIHIYIHYNINIVSNIMIIRS